MRASLMTKAGSLAAAAAIATTGAVAATGAAGAATALPRLPTSLTATRVVHKPFTLILGHLSSHKVPLRGEVIFLDRRSGKVLITVAHSVTNKGGNVGFVVAPKKPTQYVLIFRGTRNFAPSSSRFVTAP